MRQANSYKSLKLVHWLFALGLLFLVFCSFFLSQSDMIPRNESFMDGWLKIIPMSIVIGISASFYVGKKLLPKARKEKNLHEKMLAYQKLDIIKMACLEIPGILACLAALQSGEIQFLFVALAIVIVMIIALPKKSKIKTELDLNASELKEFSEMI